MARTASEGMKIALFSMLVISCVPFLLVAGLGAVMFFVATAYLQGRQYFELAAMRFHPPAEAKALRKMHQGTGVRGRTDDRRLVSILIVDLATPLFGTAFMVHMHKRLTGAKLIDNRR